MTKLVAKVGNKDITEADVLRFMEEIGPQVAMQFQSEDGIKTIIQEMINQELLLLDAKEQKMDQESAFVEVLEQTKDNLLKNYAFSKVIGSEVVSDEEAEKFFADNKALFAKETVEASHILVDTLEKANEIKAELDNGKNFEEAAKEYSKCPSKEVGGALGEFGKGSMVKEFETAAFAMEEGQISEPVKTQFGYHIIKLTKKNSADSTELKDVIRDVRSEALRRKQQEVYLKKLEELNKKYDSEIIDTKLGK